MCSAIAELEPIFEPGTKTAYQAVNFGLKATGGAPLDSSSDILVGRFDRLTLEEE